MNTVDKTRADASRATRQRWDERYRQGVLPWDTQLTPPEVVDFWQQARLAPHSLAVDLGCGPGTNVRYLATLGLTVIGVEIASAPLVMARQRLERFAPEALSRVRLLCADVSRLPFHGLNANYFLDIGCFHSLPRTLRPGYINSVKANLAAGGFYQLYAFDADSAIPDPSSGPVGVDKDEIAEQFAPHLQVVEEVVARPDRRPCRWYLLQRPQ
jgi:SAM-dependent methyltransferase